MKKIGIIILAVIILAGIAVLTLVLEVIGYILGAILFLVAIFFLGYLFNKIKNKLT
ncbi:MAG: hypothetical protein R6W85_06375 [Gillisia sp.]